MVKNLVAYSQYFLERGLLPDALIRFGIRCLLSAKLRDEAKARSENGLKSLIELIDQLKKSPIAVDTQAANEQHYELPTAFFQLVLGAHLKYSSGYWHYDTTDLSEAEKNMLALTGKRAEIQNGQRVIELGCGWGSLTLWMAEHFPQSQITAVSNSMPQREFIESRLQARKLKNVTVITADMNVFDINEKFDRVVSVEMFEHMRNYQKLLSKISGWLKDEGKLFVHIFTHREFAYLFEGNDPDDWIGKYFFTGGIMPSDHLLLYFQDDFKIEDHWQVNGTHYQKTAESWLKNMDRNKDKIIPILKTVYGTEDKKWWSYWRVFFMSCVELWGFNEGKEWLVSHYLFKKR